MYNLSMLILYRETAQHHDIDHLHSGIAYISLQVLVNVYESFYHMYVSTYAKLDDNFQNP